MFVTVEGHLPLMSGSLTAAEYQEKMASSEKGAFLPLG